MNKKQISQGKSFQWEQENNLNTFDSNTELLESRFRTFSTQQSVFLSKLVNIHSLEEISEKDPFELPFLVITPYSSFKKLWTSLIAISLFYTSWVLPFRMAFEPDLSANVLSDLINLDIVIDCIFMADVVVNSLSAYEDKEGVLVYNKAEIFRNYIQFWFWIDIISCFPFYFLTAHPVLSVVNKVFKLFRLPKLLRLITLKKLFNFKDLPIYGRLHKKLSKMLSNLDKNTGFSLFNTMYWFSFLIHLFSCLWYYVIQFEKGQDVGNTWVIVAGLADSGITDKYLAALYFVLTVMITIGYGTITPTTKNEKILTIFIMFFGILFYGKLMGALLELYGKIRNEHKDYDDRANLIDFFAKFSHFPRHFHERLLNNLVDAGKLDSKASVFEKFVSQGFFQNICETTLSEICLYLFKSEVKKFPFFEEKPPMFLTKLLLLVKTISYSTGEEIYTQGENPLFIYFILEGRVSSDYFNPECEEITLSLTEGSYFGEIEVFFNLKRQMTKFTRRNVVLWRLDSDNFSNLLQEYPEIEQEMLDIATLKKNKINALKEKPSENPAMFPMNYWRYHREISKEKPFLETILYKKGDNNFREYGKEYFFENFKVILMEMEARKFLLEKSVFHFQIEEDEINFRACKNLNNRFLREVFQKDFKNFAFWMDECTEIRRKIKDLRRYFQKVDEILGECKNMFNEMKSLKKLSEL